MLSTRSFAYDRVVECGMNGKSITLSPGPILHGIWPPYMILYSYRMINTYSFVFTSEYILYFHLRSALNVLNSAVIENGVQISRIRTLRRKMSFLSTTELQHKLRSNNRLFPCEDSSQSICYCLEFKRSEKALFIELQLKCHL